MPRDYKHSRADFRRPLPGWIWLLTGLVIGLTVAFLVYLHGQKLLKEGRQSAVNIAVETDSRQPKTVQAQESIAASKRSFDFYTLLPELEVVVPQEPQRQEQTTPRTKPSPGSNLPEPIRNNQTTTGSYFLQAGSFQRSKEADSLKAKLALLGVESSIETVRVNTETWHRVRIGPYENRTQLNQIRAKLRKNNVDTLLLMAKD